MQDDLNQIAPVDLESKPASLQSKIDIVKALKLRLQGHTYASIAQRFGVTPQAVYQRMVKYNEMLDDPVSIKAYQENEPDLLDAVKAKIVTRMMKAADDPKTSLNNMAYAWTQLNVGKRLISNQSTSNVHVLSEIVERANKQNIPDIASSHSNIQDDTETE